MKMLCGRELPHTRKTNRGFTLIELLVTIAIISILSAILFPVFARARENARRASCLSNLKQLGLGIMMYAQDFDEKYPPGQNDNKSQPRPTGFGTSGISGDGWTWPEMIYSYVKNMQVFVCPSSDKSDISSAPAVQDTLRYRNYGANSLTLMDIRGRSPLSLAAVQSPAEKYMLMDAGTYRVDPSRVIKPTASFAYIPGTRALCSAGSAVASGSEADWESGRHLDGVNILFADGHAKWMKSTVVFTETKKCVTDSNCIVTYSTPPTVNSAWNPFAD